MTVVLCFSHDDTAVLHYKDDFAARLTLCGKRAFPAYPKRSRVTCPACKALKPKILGGST